MKSFELFGQNEIGKELVIACLDDLRGERLDIRKFNLNQLCKFIDNVAYHTPNELPVFFNYTENALDSGFYKLMNSDDFNNLAEIIYIFTREGLFTLAGNSDEKVGKKRVN